MKDDQPITKHEMLRYIEASERKMKLEILNTALPVGTIYFNETDERNPEDIFGFGTWEATLVGHVPAGIEPSGTFDTLGDTVGSETHTLTTAQLPSHSHSLSFPTTQYVGDVGTGGNITATAAGTFWRSNRSFPTSTGNAGSGQAHNIIQPTQVVMAWVRTA